MKVVLISVYDDYATGPRFWAAYLKAKGHDVYLLNLKTFVVKLFSYDTNELAEFYKTSNATLLEEVRTDGIILCPYPTPVTEIEKKLLIDKLQEIKPDVVGFTVTSLDINLMKELTRNVKKEFPSVPIIWGGGFIRPLHLKRPLRQKMLSA